MNDILRFGVIGSTGRFGKHYMRLLQHTEGVILNHAVGRDAEKVLDDSAIDCVVIATPVSTHFELCQRALMRGKHVLAEKPMVRSLEEAHRLLTLIHKKNLTFMVGHQYVYHNCIQCLKEKLVENMLGRVRYISTEHMMFGTIRHDVGCFWEIATHELAVIDYLFSPGRILDVSGKMVSFSGTKKDDFASVSILFENGLVAAMTVSWFAPMKVFRMILGGYRGTAIFDERPMGTRFEFSLLPYPEQHFAQSWRLDMAEADRIFIPPVAVREPLRNELDHFIECVRGNKTPLTDIEHGFRVTAMLDAIMSALGR